MGPNQGPSRRGKGEGGRGRGMGGLKAHRYLIGIYDNFTSQC